MTVITSFIAGKIRTEASQEVSVFTMIINRTISLLLNLAYTLLGFAVLLAGWYGISIITKAELPTPFATLSVLWDLVKDPFYDYGPNDKGIALQLGSSLLRVFTGFFI